MSPERRWPAPWVFSLLILPLGMVVGFNFTSLPYLLSEAGVRVDHIASVTAIGSLPGVLGILIAPLVDIKLRRRTWLAVGVFGTAMAALIYFPFIGASHLVLLTALIFCGGMLTSLDLDACGGLIVRLLDSPGQSKAAAWMQAGVLGSGALGGAMVIWLAARMPLAAVGLFFAAVTALVGYIPFTIQEPAPKPSPWFRGRFIVLGKEIWALARSPERRWGSLLLLSPCATGAAQGLLPAIASHYGVGGGGVMWINGIGGGAALAVGALCSTLVPGNWDRRLTYAAAGVTNALAAIFLLTANRPAVYLAGTVFYLVTEGLCAARSMALIVELVGMETRDASTVYAVLNAAVSFPIAYVTWLDGVGFRYFGTHGLLLTDALVNVLVFAIVGAAFIACGAGLRKTSAA